MGLATYLVLGDVLGEQRRWSGPLLLRSEAYMFLSRGVTQQMLVVRGGGVLVDCFIELEDIGSADPAGSLDTFFVNGELAS